MFATTRSFVPEPRQEDQPRRYIGRHRVPEAVTAGDRPAAGVDDAASPAETDPTGAMAPLTEADAA